jgi:hypothetical protein
MNACCLFLDPGDIIPNETLRLVESMRTCLEANANIVEGVFKDFKSCKNGLIKALTRDVEEFYL